MMPIDRITCAESMITLLGRLNVDRFPPEERMAVARVQVEAIDDWLAAYMESAARTAAARPVVPREISGSRLAIDRASLTC